MSERKAFVSEEGERSDLEEAETVPARLELKFKGEFSVRPDEAAALSQPESEATGDVGSTGAFPVSETAPEVLEIPGVVAERVGLLLTAAEPEEFEGREEVPSDLEVSGS